jgi:hypothetical protein
VSWPKQRPIRDADVWRHAVLPKLKETTTMSTAQDDASAMLLAWRHGRKDAREGRLPKTTAQLAILPTDDERDAYLAGYEQTRANAAERKQQREQEKQRAEPMISAGWFAQQPPLVQGSDRKTYFVRLPRSVQRTIDGGCSCEWCMEHPSAAPMWDTLAFTHSNDAFVVHHPEPIK